MGAGGDRIKHAFIWPAVLLVLAVTLFPLVYSLSISFQQVRLVPPSPRFVGLANYTTLLSQARFWQVLGNTAFLAVSRSPSSTWWDSPWPWHSSPRCRASACSGSAS